jgi:cytochrome c peroxidase
VSCSTCHKPELAFTDQKPLAVGIFGRVGKRHSPSIVNRGLGASQFWDGRAASLEVLSLMPLRDPNEMDLPPDEAVARLTADASYRAAFQAAFGGPPSTDDLGRALASFVRVVRSENAPYDRFVAGDKASLTDEQQRGLVIFRTRGRCTFCHREPTFTDEQFHNTGVAWKPAAEGSGGSYQDDGQFAVSKVERTRGSFKTPTLREIARTAPYMHDGSLATLADVVDFYDKGGRPNPNLFPVIRPLNLTDDDKRALVKFLESLNGEVSSTVLGRDRTSPDFSGTWTPVPAPSAGEAPPPPAPWSSNPVTITQSLGSVTILGMISGQRPPMTRRLYNLNGSEVTITDRPPSQGGQRVTTRGSWKDWQLVLTAIQPVTAADGTTSKEEIVQVLTLDSASTLSVKITRSGEKAESWTLKYRRSP